MRQVSRQPPPLIRLHGVGTALTCYGENIVLLFSVRSAAVDKKQESYRGVANSHEPLNSRPSSSGGPKISFPYYGPQSASLGTKVAESPVRSGSQSQ
jgi:hypothetical protein